MNMLKITLIFFILSLSTSCTTRQLIPISEDSKKELSIIGVTMLPPSGKGWNYQIVHPARIQFGKFGDYELQTITASVVLHKLPVADSEQQFLAEVSKERWGQNDEQERFNNVLVEETIVHEKNTLCIRYNTIYQDFGSQYLQDSNQHFVVEDIGLICRHPENEKVGVSIGVSQRYKPGRMYRDFKEVANAFIANAKFEELPQE